MEQHSRSLHMPIVPRAWRRSGVNLDHRAENLTATHTHTPVWSSLITTKLTPNCLPLPGKIIRPWWARGEKSGSPETGSCNCLLQPCLTCEAVNGGPSNRSRRTTAWCFVFVGTSNVRIFFIANIRYECWTITLLCITNIIFDRCYFAFHFYPLVHI